MKVRNGFVSNSSSSSFVLHLRKINAILPEEKIKELASTGMLYQTNYNDLFVGYQILEGYDDAFFISATSSFDECYNNAKAKVNELGAKHNLDLGESSITTMFQDSCGGYPFIRPIERKYYED